MAEFVKLWDLVQDDLINQSLTRGLWRMETVHEMAEFVKLWDLVQAQQLNDLRACSLELISRLIR